MSWLSQCPVVTLECVVPAATNSFVRHHLDAFHSLGYQWTELTLSLEEMWGACRHRWWAVAVLEELGKLSMTAPPINAGILVRDLMPYVQAWPLEEVEQLALTDHEFDAFTANGVPIRKYCVKMDQKLPTALHSWGGQVVPCACECRQTGFSQSMIESKGIFAQIVPIPAAQQTPGGPKFRHLHAKEVALLCGMPPKQSWSSDQRLNLCGVGQLASPLQAVWIASQIKP